MSNPFCDVCNIETTCIVETVDTQSSIGEYKCGNCGAIYSMLTCLICEHQIIKYERMEE